MTDKELRFIDYAKQIKSLGYKVVVTNRPNSCYGWVINDKDQIGYFQLGDYGWGIRFSSIHKGTRDFGQGFMLDDWDEAKSEFTKEIVDRCFVHHPAWAKGNVGSIVKYSAKEYLDTYWDKKNLVEI